MKVGFTLVALCALALSGCELVTGPEDERPGSRLPSTDFSAWLVRPGDPPAPELDVRGEAGRIVAQGAVGTPVPCYAFEAFANVRGQTVDLVVVGSAQQGVACIMVLALFGYEATIRDLAPGTYTVNLGHTVNGTRRDILQTEVVVD